jgi:ATP synthase protein I
MLLARISGIGWFVVGSIGAGVGVGWWLDRQFGTEPVLLLAGLLLGVIGAFAGMIRMLSAFGKQRTRR